MICCDFCRKPHSEVGHMILGLEGAQVAICDECAGVAVDIAIEHSGAGESADGYLGALKARWQQEACQRVAAAIRKGGYNWDKLGTDKREAAANIANLVGNEIQQEHQEATQ